MAIQSKNPIMPGFYPDPSICAVGEDYYLVNSSFAYFPGLPLMHSKDLVHFEQIGNVLDRPSQLPLPKAGVSRGLFAPTIRYHEGTFYVICTNVSYGGNFVVTAENPEGPWSEPHYLEGADGIDPSLFFDADGKCYYIGTHPNPAGCQYDGDWYIYIQELDVKNWKMVGEKHNVWNGAMRGVHWPEGPHLYKIGEYYYILHAEGGTGPEHAVSVARSKEVFGPYENNFCNPILTHRHMGQQYPIKYVGHADLIETPNGEWYMTMLAVRPKECFTTMGRETFLAKVTWENDWPVVNAGVGLLTDVVTVDLPEWLPAKDATSYTARTAHKTCVPGSSRTYAFASMKELGDEFMTLRAPLDQRMVLSAGEGLKLSFSKNTLTGSDVPSYVCIRQQHHCFTVSASLLTASVDGDSAAGLVLFQNEFYHLKVEVKAGKASLILCEKSEDKVLGELSIAGDEVTVGLEVKDLEAKGFVVDASGKREFKAAADVRNLSTEVAGGFVGCTTGLYALGDETKAAIFTKLSYQA
ncbi:MAG: glycoside hydrolase family 43 protein [Lachnospiraceae bacterium]|jgi:alpha-N-arabinofuranosidase|nr:glycoside hydrolase family 43 protein [Lachnospiraceae bacterium]